MVFGGAAKAVMARNEPARISRVMTRVFMAAFRTTIIQRLYLSVHLDFYLQVALRTV
jgi:hypothetical protein